MSNDLGPIKHIYLNKDNLDEVLGAFIMTEHGPKSVPVFPGEESGFGNVDVKYVSPDADVAKLFEKRFSQCGAKSNVPSWIGKVFGKAKEIISDVVEVIGGAAKAVAEAVDTTVEVVVQALETGGQECFAMLDETVKVSGDAQLEIIDQGLELFVEGANTPEVVLLDPQVLPVDISVPMSGDISEAMISSMLI